MESPKILLCSAQPELFSEWAQALSPIATVIECTQLGRLGDLVRIRQPDIILFHIDGQTHRIDEAVSVVLQHEDIQLLVLDVMPNDEDGVVLLKAGVRGYANESLSGPLMQKRNSKYSGRRHLGQPTDHANLGRRAPDWRKHWWTDARSSPR